MGINEVYGFYEKLLKMLDLTIDMRGQIFLELENSSMPVLINGIPMYLPTTENIRTMFDIVKGKSVKVKEIFNPLNENAFKGGNASFIKLKSIIDVKLMGVFYYLTESLLVRASQKGADENDMNIIKLQSLISRYKTTAKHSVDQRTITDWNKILLNMQQKYINKKYISLVITKGSKVNDIDYNRFGTVTFPIGEELLKLTPKDRTILDVSLRAKDVSYFNTMYEFIFGDNETITNGIQVRSMNKTAPSLHALLLAYDKVFKILEPLIDTVKNGSLEDDVLEALSLNPIPIEVDNLSSFIDDLESGARMIPSDTNSAADVNGFGEPIKPTKASKKDFWSNMKDKITTTPNPTSNVNPYASQGHNNQGYSQPVQPNNINRTFVAPVLNQGQSQQQSFTVVNQHTPQQQQSQNGGFWGNARKHVTVDPYAY